MMIAYLYDIHDKEKKIHIADKSQEGTLRSLAGLLYDSLIHINLNFSGQI